MSAMRAAPWTPSVLIGICQPGPGPRGNAHVLQHDREQARGYLFAGGHDGIILACVMHGCGFAAPADQAVSGARHGGDHDRHVVAGLDLTFDMARDVADAVDVRNRRPTELHDQTAHRPKPFNVPAVRNPAKESGQWPNLIVD